MTLLGRHTIYDLNKMEALIYGQMIGEGDTFTVDSYFNGLFKVDCRSPLETKLDDLINTYWSTEGSKAYHAILTAQKANPRTKDIFRSKSTPHTFPWYHRNRKY